ncbi:MAG: SlyX family protein [Deltaproteobacteria bacterium]|nr:MAG: SlyX family protein [Deltaproteobacteria bacterium]
MDDETLEARVTELEIRYMRQEDLLQQLSDLVRDQQDVIDRLVRTVREYELTLAGQPPHERPPHY